jgi:hypothetical protein
MQAGQGVPAASEGSHPAGVKPETKAYAEKVRSYLLSKGGRISIGHLGTDVKKPDGAEKLGKMLNKYDTWFERTKRDGACLLSCTPSLL